MKNVSLSQLKPISELPRSYAQLAEEVQSGEEIIFLKRSTPYVVLLDFERWQTLTELENQANEAKALANLEKSEAEYKAGKAKTLQSLADLSD